MRKAKLIRIVCFIILSLLLLSSCAVEEMDKTDEQFTSNVGVSDVSATDISPPVNETDINDISFSKKLEVHYIDVGQGDSELIILPNNKIMLIDTGDPNHGVPEYIKSLGIDTIDYLVFTHPHQDHIGDGVAVINQFNIGEIYMPRKSHNSDTFENLLLAIQNKGLQINTAKAGVNILNEGNLSIDILGPSREFQELNNVSAIIKITYGDNKFLFTGDAEIEALESVSGDLSADVYKVGHHGSNTSTTEHFLEKISPKHAVISCGKDNQYGHPHNEVLTLLNNSSIKTYRTDEVGTIIIKSDGSNLTVDKNASVIKANAPPEEYNNTDTDNINDSNVDTVDNDYTVYITRTGSKYHRETCGYLKSKIETTKNQALKEGLSPCSRCNP